ncbi:MAG: hypothetical protein DPW09_36200 [Anaerolineae bacterium]|nr:hypothetical protein [Anaerolineales bacterium]MCQ3978897.1 hypothetical protein [Anaerolineae bacterium]
MSPNINLSKVKTIGVEGDTLYVWYKSGVFRRFQNVDLDLLKERANQTNRTIHGLNDQPQPPDGAIWCDWCGERPALPGEPCEHCRKLGAEPEHLEEQTGQTESPNALVAMLGLSPEQAKHLEGADRLNFWRNGSLNVQIQHGSRGVKVACPKAVVTDADLVMFFLSWGWQQLGDKLYFKPNGASLVRL